jgi:hypothetical protein
MNITSYVSEKLLTRETQRFIIAGSFNTLFCYVVFSILLFIGLGNIISMTIATLATIALSFFLMGRYVFGCDLTLKRSLVFFAMQSAAYIINIHILKLITWIGFSAYFGGIISLFLTAIFTYLVTKYLVFSKPVSNIK